MVAAANEEVYNNKTNKKKRQKKTLDLEETKIEIKTLIPFRIKATFRSLIKRYFNQKRHFTLKMLHFTQKQHFNTVKGDISTKSDISIYIIWIFFSGWTWKEATFHTKAWAPVQASKRFWHSVLKKNILDFRFLDFVFLTKHMVKTIIFNILYLTYFIIFNNQPKLGTIHCQIMFN